MFFSQGLYCWFPAYDNFILLILESKFVSNVILPSESVCLSVDVLFEYNTLIVESGIFSLFAVLSVAVMVELLYSTSI